MFLSPLNVYRPSNLCKANVFSLSLSIQKTVCLHINVWMPPLSLHLSKSLRSFQVTNASWSSFKQPLVHFTAKKTYWIPFEAGRQNTYRRVSKCLSFFLWLSSFFFFVFLSPVFGSSFHFKVNEMQDSTTRWLSPTNSVCFKDNRGKHWNEGFVCIHWYGFHVKCVTQWHQSLNNKHEL